MEEEVEDEFEEEETDLAGDGTTLGVGRRRASVDAAEDEVGEDNEEDGVSFEEEEESDGVEDKEGELRGTLLLAVVDFFVDWLVDEDED